MIQALRLEHFRTYIDRTFTFGPGVNIIVGPNASGKTNLLEAILVMARGKSYRAKDRDLIAFKSFHAVVSAECDGTSRKVILQQCAPTKTYKIEGLKLSRLTPRHILPVVLFEPNHLALLIGPPVQRRAYLDELLIQTNAEYGAKVQAYQRVLLQRNALLKRLTTDTTQFFPWDIRLAELGGVVARARAELVKKINQEIVQIYQKLAPTDTPVKLTAQYQTGAELAQYESYMIRHLETRLVHDRLRGVTSFGPHRDDLLVQFDGRLADQVASRGETRTTVLALKLIELQLLHERRGQAPILLLDDVFSELDSERREALITYLSPYQTFITTTDADALSPQFADRAQVIEIQRSDNDTPD